MTHEYESIQHEVVRPHHISFGIAASNLGNINNPGLAIPEQLPHLCTLLDHSNMGLELQPEQDLHFHKFIGQSTLPFLGLHLPTQRVNLGDTTMIADSLRRINQSIRMGISLDVVYFCYHMQTQDYWDEISTRKDSISKSYEHLDKIISFARTEGFKGMFLIENLEYPKYPSTISEFQEVQKFTASIDKTHLLFDIAHLWRSKDLMKENEHHIWSSLSDPDISFINTDFSLNLKQTLQSFNHDIKVMHITGASGEKTHLLPSLVSSQSIEHHSYLDITETLKELTSFASSRVSPLFVINEAIGYNYSDMITANHALLDSISAV